MLDVSYDQCSGMLNSKIQLYQLQLDEISKSLKNKLATYKQRIPTHLKENGIDAQQMQTTLESLEESIEENTYDIERHHDFVLKYIKFYKQIGTCENAIIVRNVLLNCFFYITNRFLF
jgi:hypothetical protein